MKRIILATLTLVSISANLGIGAQSLSLIDLGTGVSAYGINASGQVTGCAPASAGTQHAFLYSAGTLTDLGTLGGGSSCGYAINVHGDVTGYADTASAAHAFLYTSGNMVDLGTVAGQVTSAGVAINANADVVGYAFPDTPFAPLVPGNFYKVATDFSQDWIAGGSSPSVHAFLWSQGVMTEVDPVNGPEQPPRFALAINDGGEIGVTSVAGCGILCPFGEAATLSGGTVSTLQDLPGTDGTVFLTVITGINDSGQIVAYGEDPHAYMHGVIYSGGKMIDMGNNTEAFAINSAGDAVGFRLGESAIGLYGVIGKDMTPLVYGNGAVRPLNMPGAIPTGINDSGWIIANHLTLDHAYVLEPSSVTLSPFGLSFGAITLGTSNPASAAACKPCTVTLKNGTASALSASMIAVTAPFKQSNNCPASLAAGDSCVITVGFAPTVADIFLGALTVNAGGTQYATLLSGTGGIQAQLTSSAQTVASGQAFTLSWTATPGSSCTSGGANGEFDSPVAASGSKTITEVVTVTTAWTFTLDCTQGTQHAHSEVTVDILTPSTGKGGGGGGALDAATLLSLLSSLVIGSVFVRNPRVHSAAWS